MPEEKIAMEQKAFVCFQRPNRFVGAPGERKVMVTKNNSGRKWVLDTEKRSRSLTACSPVGAGGKTPLSVKIT